MPRQGGERERLVYVYIVFFLRLKQTITICFFGPSFPEHAVSLSNRTNARVQLNLVPFTERVAQCRSAKTVRWTGGYFPTSREQRCPILRLIGLENENEVEYAPANWWHSRHLILRTCDLASPR